jgi:hypothetical protein
VRFNRSPTGRTYLSTWTRKCPSNIGATLQEAVVHEAICQWAAIRAAAANEGFDNAPVRR